MGRYLPSSFSDLPPLTITAAIDIVIVAILIYQFLLIIRGRRAVHVLLGLCVLGLIYAAAVWAKLELLHTILATLAPYTAIALDRHVSSPNCGGRWRGWAAGRSSASASSNGANSARKWCWRWAGCRRTKWAL